jgi:hypothetical protein
MTGCEVIWSQGNRGCYAHTKEIDRGNGRARHGCWVRGKEPEPEVETIEIGAMEKGFCVSANGRDQNSGVRKLNSLDINTQARRNECLNKCVQVPGVTGCEGIWSQGNRGCYAHTKPVARGNGRARHSCWVVGK